MNQANSILSTYTADVSGVCSALYELGGLTVIHDASGCNSTYTTHDEPRWYDIPSMVYISALTETEAVLGDDGKLIADVTQAVSELRPRFFALAGTPIPAMMGTDLPGIARLIERRTGVPGFGFATTGMASYVLGAGAALANLARRFCPEGIKKEPGRVNILGATPLDFSVNGTVEAIKSLLEGEGFTVQGCWAMGSACKALEWEELTGAGRAGVNLVVSACGLPLAEVLREKYGTPYVVGLPVGKKLAAEVLSALRRAEKTGENQRLSPPSEPEGPGKLGLVIGEGVWAGSLARALALDCGVSARALCPLESDGGMPGTENIRATDEDAIAAEMAKASFVIADPLYKGVLTEGVEFIPFPHEAYSGRIWREEIPMVIDNGQWIIDNYGVFCCAKNEP